MIKVNHSIVNLKLTKFILELKLKKDRNENRSWLYLFQKPKCS